ncbi:hypothetical protein HPP92_012924 [Vanilla planifolia]|uniref:Uncharacterized protein n=1 Tax=Vanilla planifolia TaxID=51239 RepID=A0A835QQR0_VANPL|nr:hypothetical protein HPP92_012924 [Vanilla planifolia]
MPHVKASVAFKLYTSLLVLPFVLTRRLRRTHRRPEKASMAVGMLAGGNAALGYN